MWTRRVGGGIIRTGVDASIEKTYWSRPWCSKIGVQLFDLSQTETVFEYIAHLTTKYEVIFVASRGRHVIAKMLPWIKRLSLTPSQVSLERDSWRT